MLKLLATRLPKLRINTVVQSIPFQWNWIDYFSSYDKLIDFFPYHNLIYDKIPSAVIKAIKTNFPEEKNIRILDAGTGTGNVILGLQERLETELGNSKQIQFIGIDTIEPALKLAQKKFANKTNVELIKGNLAQINFGLTGEAYQSAFEKKYQIVVLNNVFYALTEEGRNAFINTVKNVLTEKGVIIISDPIQAPNKRWQFKLVWNHFINKGFKGISLLLKNKKETNHIRKLNSKVLNEKNFQFLSLRKINEFMHKHGFELITPPIKAYAGLNRISVYQT